MPDLGLPPARPRGLATTANTGFQSRFTRMAEVTFLHGPGDLAIMAHTAILTVDDFSHVYLVRPGTHFKPQLMMTHLAAKSDSMKPVRKDYRTHIVGLGKPVQDHVGIFCIGFWRYASHCQHQ